MVTDPADLARRLQQAGLGCDDYAEEEPLEGPGYPERKGVCTLSGGESIAIDVLADEARWNEYVAAGEEACAWTDGEEFLYAAGHWWSIAPSAETDPNGTFIFHNDTTRAIATALNARVESLIC